MRSGKIGRAITGSFRQRAIMYHESDISAMSNSSYTGRRQASPVSARRGCSLMPSAVISPLSNGRVRW